MRDDVGAGVQPEDLQLGADPFGAGELGQTAAAGQCGCVPERQDELGMPVAHLRGGRRLGLGGRECGDVEVTDGAGTGGDAGLLDQDVQLTAGMGGSQGAGVGHRRPRRLPTRTGRRHRRWPPGPPGADAPRSLGLAAAAGAHPPVELGDVQEQVAASDPLPDAQATRAEGPVGAGAGGRRDPVDRVQPTGQDEPFQDGSAHLGPVGEVGQVGERLAGDDPGDLGVGDPLDVGERHPDPVAPPVRDIARSRYSAIRMRCRNTSTRASRRGQTDTLDGIPALAGVDVQAEDLDAQGAGVVEDEAFGIHAGVVGEHPSEEGRRMMGLEPGRLIGGQRERRCVRFAEAERRERPKHLPDPVGIGCGIAPSERRWPPPRLHVELTLRRAERPADLVGLGQAHPRRLGDDPQHLLVEDDDAGGLR